MLTLKICGNPGTSHLQSGSQIPRTGRSATPTLMVKTMSTDDEHMNIWDGSSMVVSQNHMELGLHIGINNIVPWQVVCTSRSYVERCRCTSRRRPCAGSAHAHAPIPMPMPMPMPMPRHEVRAC